MTNNVIIMIIDDDDADQFLTSLAISKHDPSIEIISAYDGLEALNILDEISQQPDVIFLDINMPRMNGFEFLKEYEKRESQTKIIAMLTSSDQNLDKEKAQQYSFVKKHFIKPIKSDDIGDILKL